MAKNLLGMLEMACEIDSANVSACLLTLQVLSMIPLSDLASLAGSIYPK